MKETIKNIVKLPYDQIPERLMECPMPPEQLYMRGVLPPETNKNLVIVGSRMFSNYGKQALRDIVAGLKGYPITIISGLALGIDSLAHEAAIENGLKTVAFPGSGLNPEVLYPRINVKLAEKIIEHGGCLFSEFEPNFLSTQYCFPQRNRLVAAFGQATLIIEAGKKSGSLITARLSLDYNRDVLVVPGSIYSETSYGTNWLLKQGATPVTCADDVLVALGFDPPAGEKKDSDHRYNDLNKDEKEIIKTLSTPMTRDEIIRAVDKSTEEITTLLMLMELRDLIKEEGGYIYKK